MEFAIRFLAGGLVVSLFAMLGDILRPKRFAGLFSAAPSVALVTLSMAYLGQGSAFARAEGRTMMLGGIALAIYSFVVCQILMRWKCSALVTTTFGLVLWFAAAVLLQLMAGQTE